ncbi:MAG TPA: cytochrome B6, partial [Patescibacteria group bacterium]|nr:cytochrome B6 [Patescibacteria group bacterium]
MPEVQTYVPSDPTGERPKKTLLAHIRESQIWTSIFRHGPPDNDRNRALAIITNVFLHLHPVRVRKSGIR